MRLRLESGRPRRGMEPRHESEELFRKIFENAATGIAITDWQGRFRQCNPAYCVLVGYSQQELQQIDFASLVHPEDREANLADLHLLQTGDVPSFEIENRYVRRDGQPVWVHKFISVLPDETGKPAYLLALVTDITERKRAGAALRESEEKLRLFIEHAPVALAMFDGQMRYLAVSRRWLADYRLGDGDIIGRSHYEVFPEIPDRWREVHRRGLEGEVVRADEDFFARVDGNIQCLRWEVRPWKQADGTIGGIVIFTEDISARKRAEEALRQREAELRALTGRLLEAQETERRRIARELHDDLNQSLALISVEIDLLSQAPPESAAQTGERLRKLSRRVKQLSSCIHDLSHQLHPSKLEKLGLVLAVRGLCLELSRMHDLPIEFRHRNVPETIPENAALCLYRIVQEAVGNIIKHSGARQARVELFAGGHALHLQIADDGKGFDVQEASANGGLGLVSIRERLRVVDGDLSIDSKPSGGTRMFVRVPLPATEKTD